MSLKIRPNSAVSANGRRRQARPTRRAGEASTEMIDIGLAPENAAELADLFKMLGDTTRLRIVLTCIDRPTSVSEIAERLDQHPSLVSHHLRLLRAARIVKSERHGKNVYYSAADHHIRCVVADMLEHITEPEAHEDA